MKPAVGLICGLGLLIMLAALWWYRSMTERLRGAVEVTGRCVGQVARPGSKGGTTYRPVIEFDGPAGPIQFTGSVGSSDPEFATGDSIPVSYPPGQPDRAMVATVGDTVGGPLFLAWFGIFFFGSGVLAWMVWGSTRRYVP